MNNFIDFIQSHIFHPLHLRFQMQTWPVELHFALNRFRKG